MSGYDWFWIGFAVAVAIGVFASHAAYYNGVNDGFGYAVDRNCPGYAKAGRYLRKYLKHRWPEVASSESIKDCVGKET